MKKLRKHRTNHPYSALEKCRAVLSIWTERRKPTEVGEQMKVSWTTLQQWQDRALEGMLQALTAHVRLQQGPALTSRLQKMLEKRGGMEENTSRQARKLSQRLEQIDQSNKAETGLKK